ncbi:hypothetical protein V6N13_138480 [Hibiscus sabdariffa]
MTAELTRCSLARMQCGPRLQQGAVSCSPIRKKTEKRIGSRQTPTVLVLPSTIRPVAEGVLHDENGGLDFWVIHNVLVHAWRLGFLFIEVVCIVNDTSMALPDNAIIDDIHELTRHRM